ncbi:MAG: prepilin peptidase [Solirubrobacterales bacterium]
MAFLLLLALIMDVNYSIVPNWLTAPAACAGLLIGAFQAGLPGLGISAAGLLLPVVALYPFFRMGTLGGGDIKLFAAIGAVMGPEFAAWSFAFSVMAALPTAVALMLYRGVLRTRMRILYRYLLYAVISLRLVPYAQSREPAAVFPFTVVVVPGVLMAGLGLSSYI